MKIRCSITACRAKDGSLGQDILEVDAVGCEATAGDGVLDEPLQFRVRNTERSRRTFRVGRELVITIEPRGQS